MSKLARWQPPSKRSPLPLRELKAIALVFLKLRLWLILIAFFLLTGCVRSDIGIRFQDANHGTIVQHIHIDPGKTGLENAIASIWLDNLEQQSKKLGGSFRWAGQQEATLTLPFFNAKDLEAKFNQLFQTEWQPKSAQSPNLPTATSHLQMRSGNWIFWQRFVLDYELDLRSLTPLTAETLSLDPSKLLQLKFSLSIPGSAKSLNAENPPQLRSKGHQLIWQLHSGELNHLQAVFWLPSPLGIGAALIGLLVVVGAIVRMYPLSPSQGEPLIEG
ncbi:DUF3153 domain-containing protein [Phormidium tenue FACHB-886]|nr:DUF3153 domain-containing protein [Phormidium tenue FACHB-886]